MSELWYPETPPKEASEQDLNTSKLPIVSVIKDIDSVSPEEFTMSRREGFGGSDSGVLCGVNPYTTLDELIKQKATRELSEEELAVRNNIAVIKGNDLEPLIIQKAAKILNLHIFKPKDTYGFKDYPYLRMNFDGVAEPESGSYIPVEIKVVTKRGERHYDRSKACFIENVGAKGPAVVEWDQNSINTIVTKAAMVGIPPYYYTQVQQEMMALNASYGFLAALEESTWTIFIYYIPADPQVQNAIRVNGFKAWERVEALRQSNGYYTTQVKEKPAIEYYQEERNGSTV